MSAKRINIVDPTLRDKTGHCYSFLNAFLDGRDAIDPTCHVVIHANRRARGLFRERDNVTLRRHFSRSLRKLQTPLLYRRLLRTGESLFIPTATRTDLGGLATMAYRHVPGCRVVAYVHWYRDTAARRKHLRWIAERIPEIRIITPSESVQRIFRETGFPACKVTPYPVSTCASHTDEEEQAFRKVVFAGAARRDKGFHHVVSWVHSLAEDDVSIPVTVQASPPHSGKYSRETAADVTHLKNTRYSNLTILQHTLPEDEYEALFHGAVCLQLYDPDEFTDRVSGVTLDALLHGAPVVALQGTWAARMVGRWNAGIEVGSPAPADISLAVHRIRGEYAEYSRRAREAGKEIQQEHHPRKLFKAVAGDAFPVGN